MVAKYLGTFSQDLEAITEPHVQAINVTEREGDVLMTQALLVRCDFLEKDNVAPNDLY